MVPVRTGAEKINFFKQTCPIEKDKVGSILYESVYGALSAIYERDFDVFCSSIKKIQSTKWKMEERHLYGGAIELIETEIYNSGAKCVGMSSLGPGLYFLADKIDNFQEGLTHEDYYIIETEFNNNARIIELYD